MDNSRLFIDICRGYSITSYKNTLLYLKHFGMEEQYIIDKEHKRLVQEARDAGFPSRDEVIVKLKRDKLWTDEEDQKIESLKTEIDNLRITKKGQILQSYIKELDAQIKGKMEEIIKKEFELNELVNICAEFHANQKINDLYIKLGFYKDSNLTQLYFDDYDCDNLDIDDINKLINLYTAEVADFNDDNIKKMVFQDSFLTYFFLSDSMKDFFGKPLYKLTFFQLRLANYGRYFKSLFENNDMDAVPEHIRKDPDKLIDYLHTQKNMDKVVKKDDPSEDKDVLFKNKAIIGAKREDLESMGETGSGTIFDKVKDNGGVMTMEDMMKSGMFR